MPSSADMNNDELDKLTQGLIETHKPKYLVGQKVWHWQSKYEDPDGQISLLLVRAVEYNNEFQTYEYQLAGHYGLVLENQLHYTSGEARSQGKGPPLNDTHYCPECGVDHGKSFSEVILCNACDIAHEYENKTYKLAKELKEAHQEIANLKSLLKLALEAKPNEEEIKDEPVQDWEPSYNWKVW
jgi:hypothetical protein